MKRQTRRRHYLAMRMFRNHTNRALERASQYAMKNDFCAIFRQQTDRLYLLALLLTAEPQRAEECLVGSLGDCIEGNPVFKDWARAWSVRAIIKRSIHMVAPLPQEKKRQPAVSSGMELTPDAAAMIAAVTQLPAFERFAFVMSVLEGYSDRDCAALLNCPLSSVAAARIQALQRIELGESPVSQKSEFYELPFSTELSVTEVA